MSGQCRCCRLKKQIVEIYREKGVLVLDPDKNLADDYFLFYLLDPLDETESLPDLRSGKGVMVDSEYTD